MFNLLNIKYFLMVEKERNFSKAAQKLYISQQALSNHIKALEDEFDAQLFERTTPLRLTEAGELILKYFQSLETDHTQFINELNDIKQVKSGHLRIGISFTRGRIILPQLLPEFTTLFPDVKLSVLEGNRSELTTALLDRKLDIMIGEFTQVHNDLTIRNLYDDELLMLIPKKFTDDETIINIQKTGDLSAIQNFPFLLNKSGNTTRNIATEIFHEQNFTPAVYFEAENMETLYELCQKDMGIMFYPKSFLDYHQTPYSCSNMHILSLPYKNVHYSIKIAYTANGYLSKAAQAFIYLAEKYL